MKAMIFGVSGQDGQYLSAFLEEKGFSVIGIDRSGKYHSVDLVTYEAVAAFIEEYKPEYVFHFAANSTTRHEAWRENHDTISTGTINILEAVYRCSPHTKVFIAGSGLQFVNKYQPIKETDEFYAGSVYSVSRIHTVYAARYYRSLGIRVYVGYFFNHDSPLRGDRHVNQRIVNTVKRIVEGSAEKLEIGNLSVRKEFGFAGDIVKAVWVLMNQEMVYETVIGTGKAFSIGEWIAYCFSLEGLDWRQYVVEKKDFIPEYEVLVSDPSTIMSLGWKPEVGFEDLAKMMMKAV